MKRRWTPGTLALLAAALVGATVITPSQAQDGGASAVPLMTRAEGAPISGIDVRLVRGSGNAARDEAIMQRLRQQLAILEGRSYRREQVERELAVVRGRMGPGRIEHRLVSGMIAGTLGLQIDVDTAGAAPGSPQAPTGHYWARPGACQSSTAAIARFSH